MPRVAAISCCARDLLPVGSPPLEAPQHRCVKPEAGMPIEVFEQDADRRPVAAIPGGNRTSIETAATAAGEPTPAAGVEPTTRASIQTAARSRVKATATGLGKAAAWAGVEAATRSGIQAAAKVGGGAPAWTGVEAAAPLSGEAAARPFVVIANPHVLVSSPFVRAIRLPTLSGYSSVRNRTRQRPSRVSCRLVDRVAAYACSRPVRTRCWVRRSEFGLAHRAQASRLVGCTSPAGPSGGVFFGQHCRFQARGR
jgi:hypothetical protein